MAEDITSALDRVVAHLPAGEARPGQRAMAEAVGAAVDGGRHLLVQAGTGTGKSLAYLVPPIIAGTRVVVATATKALQEQLVHKDLPLLARHLGVPFEAALLKGRSNYLCRAALADTVGDGTVAMLDERDGATGGTRRAEELVAWAERSDTGDRADLPFAVSGADWARVSVGAGECPGARRCPNGDDCFAERARHRAAAADVVVVNTHLYCVHLATGGAVLPPHDLVVIDEAHALEAIASDTFCVSVGSTRFEHVSRGLRALFTERGPADALLAAASRLDRGLARFAGRRVDPAGDELAGLLLAAGEAAATALAQVRALQAGGETASRRERLLQAAGNLVDDLRALAEPVQGSVAWVEGGPVPVLRMAPVAVGPALAARLFGETTAVLTSATMQVGGSFGPLAERLGLEPGSYDELDAGSPFDHEAPALLYCAAHLPDPRAAAYEPAMLDELERLVRAAGGRTLALFTSRRAMEAAAVHLRERVEWQVLVQDELPRPKLRDAFIDDETSCLLATMGFWQGFDAPGRTCSLVVIDRLPFARPDEPLAQARREAATRQGRNSFAAVDLPQAAVLLAQGAGRLIRGAGDRGVVAVLDRRLAHASYRWTLVRSLPPMRRTRDFEEVATFLASNE